MVEAGADHVSARTGVLVRVTESDGCVWGSGTSGGNSARSPRCKPGEHLLLESPACAAGPKPPGPLTH